MKIALGQINPTVGDFAGNAARIIHFAQRAKSEAAGLILFPELSVGGYPPRDLVERASFVHHKHEAAEHIRVRQTFVQRQDRPADSHREHRKDEQQPTSSM